MKIIIDGVADKLSDAGKIVMASLCLVKLANEIWRRRLTDLRSRTPMQGNYFYSIIVERVIPAIFVL